LLLFVLCCLAVGCLYSRGIRADLAWLEKSGFGKLNVKVTLGKDAKDEYSGIVKVWTTEQKLPFATQWINVSARVRGDNIFCDYDSISVYDYEQTDIHY
jgi:hypothetical protein